MRIPLARDCMTALVATCEPQADLEHAAHLMWTNDCGVLPVVDDAQHVVGILTDRDLAMGAYTQGRALRDLRVSESMTSDVGTCFVHESIEDVIRALGERRVHRMPVVDESGVVQGILSLSDLVRRVASMDESPMRSRIEAELLRSMAAICEPRRPQQEVARALPARGSKQSRSVGAR